MSVELYEIAHSEVFKALVDDLAAIYTKEMLNSRPDDAPARNMAHLHYVVLQNVYTHILSMSAKNNLTKAQLREIAGKKLLSFT